MDSKERSFRKDIYEAYKANRPPAPPDLRQQMLRVREILEAWRMSPIEIAGFEADDIIASVVKQARARGLRVVIVSADKDLLQLVGADVVMYDTMRDKVFGAEETREKLGVEPGQVRDLLALMGDSSDNVPNVHSVDQKPQLECWKAWKPRRYLREPRAFPPALRATLAATADR
jgi:DNA polymerase-1